MIERMRGKSGEFNPLFEALRSKINEIIDWINEHNFDIGDDGNIYIPKKEEKWTNACQVCMDDIHFTIIKKEWRNYCPHCGRNLQEK